METIYLRGTITGACAMNQALAEPLRNSQHHKNQLDPAFPIVPSYQGEESRFSGYGLRIHAAKKHHLDMCQFIPI